MIVPVIITSIILGLLKLGGALDWSWFWTLSPVWGYLAVLFICMAVLGFLVYWENR